MRKIQACDKWVSRMFVYRLVCVLVGEKNHYMLARRTNNTTYLLARGSSRGCSGLGLLHKIDLPEQRTLLWGEHTNLCFYAWKQCAKSDTDVHSFLNNVHSSQKTC